MRYVKYFVLLFIIVFSLQCSCRTTMKEGMGQGDDDLRNVQYNKNNNNELEQDLVCELLDEDGKVIEVVPDYGKYRGEESGNDASSNKSMTKEQKESLIVFLSTFMGIIVVCIILFSMYGVMKYIQKE